MVLNIESLGRRLGMMIFATSMVAASPAGPASRVEPDGQSLKGKRVAILVTDGFEQSELVEPRKALNDAGAKTTLVSPQAGQVRGWKNTDWGDRFNVDVVLDEAKLDQFDALVLPGGVFNPDKLRTLPKAVAFVRGFVDASKPVAAICHGSWRRMPCAAGG